jgi:hypothetical protein
MLLKYSILPFFASLAISTAAAPMPGKLNGALMVSFLPGISSSLSTCVDWFFLSLLVRCLHLLLLQALPAKSVLVHHLRLLPTNHLHLLLTLLLQVAPAKNVLVHHLHLLPTNHLLHLLLTLLLLQMVPAKSVLVHHLRLLPTNHLLYLMLNWHHLLQVVPAKSVLIHHLYLLPINHLRLLPINHLPLSDPVGAAEVPVAVLKGVLETLPSVYLYSDILFPFSIILFHISHLFRILPFMFRILPFMSYSTFQIYIFSSDFIH